MSTNNNTDQAADLARRLSFILTVPDPEDHTYGVIRCERARAAYEDLTAPMVFQLNKLMKEELGPDYSATLTLSGKCFDDNCLEASINLWGRPNRARTIQLFVEDGGEGSAMFNLWGSERILENASFELSNDGISVFYESLASFFPGETAYAGSEYVRFDATGDFLAFFSDELTAFLAG